MTKTADMSRIELGDEVEDWITGVQGICVAITEWINGCRRILIQPVGIGKEGKPYDTYCADEPYVKVVKRQALVPTGVTAKEAEKVQAGEQPIRRVGGPRPKPSRPPTPSRN